MKTYTKEQIEKAFISWNTMVKEDPDSFDGANRPDLNEQELIEHSQEQVRILISFIELCPNSKQKTY